VQEISALFERIVKHENVDQQKANNDASQVKLATDSSQLS
jgi:hypothetical protein